MHVDKEGISVSSDGNVGGNSSKGSNCGSGSCDGDSCVSPMAAAKWEEMGWYIIIFCPFKFLIQFCPEAVLVEGVILSEATVVTLVVAVIVMALATAEQGVVEGSLDR